MNSDNIYKGLKYVVVWILLYFFVKYAGGEDLSDVDAALVSAVLTLLLCILENMYNIAMPCSKGSDQKKECLDNVKIDGDLNLSGKQVAVINQGVHHTMNSLTGSTVPNVAAMSYVSNNAAVNPDVNTRARIDAGGMSNSSSDSSSDGSSNSSRNGGSSSSDEMPSGDIAESYARRANDYRRPLEHYNVNSPASSQSLVVDNGDTANFTREIQEGDSQYYIVKDYMGEKVLFNKDDFGGTSEQLNELAYTDFGGTNYAQTKKHTTQLGGTDVTIFPKDTITDEGIPNIHIPVPKDGSGKVYVRPDSAILSTDGGSNQSGNSSSHDSNKRSSGTKLKWYEQAFDPRRYSGAENLDQIAVAGGKTRNDLLVNEMIYSDFNRMPPSFNDKDFEYGYSYLPPKDWYPLPPYPPVCSSNTTCLVQPVYLDNETMNLKEWHETQKITAPDSINTDFITNEMNSRN